MRRNQKDTCRYWGRSYSVVLKLKRIETPWLLRPSSKTRDHGSRTCFLNDSLNFSWPLKDQVSQLLYSLLQNCQDWKSAHQDNYRLTQLYGSLAVSPFCNLDRLWFFAPCIVAGLWFILVSAFIINSWMFEAERVVLFFHHHQCDQPTNQSRFSLVISLSPTWSFENH